MGNRLLHGAIAAIVGSVAYAATAGSQPSRVDLKHLSAKDRLAAIRHATVWRPTDIASMDLLNGPQGPGAFGPDEMVTCTYVDRRLDGATPKFACEVEPGDEVKVKYGRDNGEVFSEVAGTRLFWALGFGADRMYPVRVTCQGCPAGVAKAGERRDTGTYFDIAAIERKAPGKEMDGENATGWSWYELGAIVETAGGAPRAHIEALELLAVFIQHTDSKSQQQRLVCLSRDEEIEKAGACPDTFMMVNDLGATFGRANLLNRAALSDANLERWRAADVWRKDSNGCVGNLPASQTGTLNNPVIGEGGRKFLADLLVQLSDAQLHDLFEAARFQMRSRTGPGPGPRASVDEWVSAFKGKRDQIVNRVCP